jgi:hypothetical protein
LDYVGSVLSLAVKEASNSSSDSEAGISTASTLDVNLNAFPSFQAAFGPYELLGDNFTAELRYNLSSSYAQSHSGVTVSGYGNRSNIAPEVFAAEDMIILYDGACGSTCTIFAELMQSQGGVRTVAVGGRPQYGPMQGVGGSRA